MSEAADPQAEALRQQTSDALKVLDVDGAAAACRWMEARGEPLAALGLFQRVMQALYFARKDVPSMIVVGRAGIEFGLAEAEKQQASDPDLADALRGEAKALAYDLGANLWPGWREEGIELTPEDLAAGLEAARLNLQLAESLHRPALPLCNAHWLLGAQELARGETAAAREQFVLARRQAQAAGAPEYEQMCRGYEALARRKLQPADDVARREMADAVAQLRDIGSDDAKFFADQLEAQAEFWLK